ncbi:MAG: Shedu anti-phage system protein SduA domain-containing protein, partial [Dehalococcoidia bacterium]
MKLGMPREDDDLPFDDREPTIGEVIDDPRQAVWAITSKRHDNIVYFDPIELHSGLYLRVVASVSVVHRHDTGEHHHIRLELIYFKRKKTSGPFTVVQKAVLEKAALEKLVASLALVPNLRALHIDAAANTLIVHFQAGQLSTAETDGLSRSLSSFLGTRQGLRSISHGLLSADALDNLQAAAQHARFKQAAEQLRLDMNDSAKTEHDYQTWFETHPWLLGTEYVRRVPARTIDIHSQADILQVSVDGFVDIFELKKPAETVLLPDRSHGTYHASAELTKALAQAM